MCSAMVVPALSPLLVTFVVAAALAYSSNPNKNSVVDDFQIPKRDRKKAKITLDEAAAAAGDGLTGANEPDEGRGAAIGVAKVVTGALLKNMSAND